MFLPRLHALLGSSSAECGAKEDLVKRGFVMPPGLINSASSQLASWAVSPVCLFWCVLMFGHFVLDCASVPKAMQCGSWNSGSG